MTNDMTTMTIIAAVIYLLYNAISIGLFGIPESLSNTYYLYKDKWNVGYLFPIMMYSVVALMMPSWITLSEGSNFQFLAFLAPASIAFVATAPAFKGSKLESNVHTIAAILAAVCSLAWVCLVTPYWWTIISWSGIVSLAVTLTKTIKTAYVYWLETIAFMATFSSVIFMTL